MQEYVSEIGAQFVHLGIARICRYTFAFLNNKTIVNGDVNSVNQLFHNNHRYRIRRTFSSKMNLFTIKPIYR